jgi:hypothetical protein
VFGAVMLKLVWVNPRDPRADEWGSLSAWEMAQGQPTDSLPLMEWLVVTASSAYVLVMLWGLRQMLAAW